MNDLFESTVFNILGRGFCSKTHTAFSEPSSFEQQITENILSFKHLKEKDPGVIIKGSHNSGYDICLTRPHLALSMKKVLAFDNSNIELMFSDEFIQFEPDEELILKSKIPLWIIKPMSGGNRVHIQRMW